ncbi:MAG: hypothetical protein ACRC5H_05930, partial [Treponemataceae bacterium]
SKKNDSIVFIIFLCILISLFIGYSFITRKSPDSGTKVKPSTEQPNNGSNSNINNGKIKNTVTLNTLANADFTRVPKNRLIGSEFRIDLTDFPPHASKNLILFDKKHTLYHFRSVLLDGKLIAVLSRQDTAGFEVVVDILIKRFSGTPSIWQGTATAKKSRWIENAVFIYEQNPDVTIARKEDISYALYANPNNKKIKKFRIPRSLTFGYGSS